MPNCAVVSAACVGPAAAICSPLLSPVASSQFAAGTAPGNVIVDREGRFAYATNHDSNNISGYVIDSSTGALTEMTGSPLAAHPGPYGIALDPSAKFAYVANDVPG